MDNRLTGEKGNIFEDCCAGICMMRHNDNGELRCHWHERMEIWHIIDGEYNMVIEKDTFCAVNGDIVIINPFEVHSCTLGSNTGIKDCFIIDINIFKGNTDPEICKTIGDILSNKISFMHHIKETPELRTALNSLIERYYNRKNGDFSSFFFTGTLMVALRILLSECLYVHGTDKTRDSGTLSKILFYLYDNYTQRITVDDMASHMNFSKYYFCRWFKDKTAQTPYGFLTAIRIKNACELLRATDLSITDVCFMSGFSDINCFIGQFKKATGTTPAAMRKQNK